MDYLDAMIRHFGMITPEAQKKLHSASIAVIGMGSVGAMAALMLAKAGAGHLTICDPDRYEKEHIVTDVFATYKTVNSYKTDAAVNAIEKHSRFCRIDSIRSEIENLEDAEKIIRGADYVIANLEEIFPALLIDRVTNKKKVPFLISINSGWTAINTTFLTDGFRLGDILKTFIGYEQGTVSDIELLRFEWDIFKMCLGGFQSDFVEKIIKKEECDWSYMAPPAYFTASFLVNDLVKLITGKGKVDTAPEMFCFNLMNNQHSDIQLYDTVRQRIIDAYIKSGSDAALAVYSRHFES